MEDKVLDLFSLKGKNEEGEEVSLADFTEDGKRLAVFFFPDLESQYSRRELEMIDEHIELFKSQGIIPIVVSPKKVNQSQYNVIYDFDMSMAKSLNLIGMAGIPLRRTVIIDNNECRVLSTLHPEQKFDEILYHRHDDSIYVEKDSLVGTQN